MRTLRYSDFEKNRSRWHPNVKQIDAMPTGDPKHRQTCMICKKKHYESEMFVTDFIAMNNFRVWRLWKCGDCAGVTVGV